MNVKYFLPLAAAVVLGTASCVKLTEDPKGNLTPGNFFSTQKELDGAVTAIYQRLAVDGAWAFTNKMTSYFGADDLTTHPASNKGPLREFDQLEGTSANINLPTQWQGPWYAIYQANNVIANYEKVAATDDNAMQLRNYAAGQAYFLRATCYFYLVRTFGALPLILGPVDIAVIPPRTEVAQVYTQIVSDLQKAASMLPDKWSGADVGRPGLLAARAELANVYLTMAGWPLNQTANYALAATEAKAVIDTKKFDLVPDYLDVFKTNNNIESVFGIEFNVGGGSPNRSFGATAISTDEGGWDDFCAEINFFKAAPKCIRTDETFTTTLKMVDKVTKKAILVPWDSAITETKHPYYRKFRYGVGDGVVETDSAVTGVQASTNKTTDVIRFAETLLTYAEASTMATGTPSDDAYEAINRVRRRAGLGELTKGLSAPAFRDSVIYERKYEFAGEFGQRWFDIVRMQLLPKVIAERSPLEANKLNASSAQNPAPKYLAPIPVADLNLSPGWTQNPSY